MWIMNPFVVNVGNADVTTQRYKKPNQVLNEKKKTLFLGKH